MRLRIGTVQYALRHVPDFTVFAEQVGVAARFAADYGCRFLLFPEYLTLQLASPGTPAESARSATARTPEYLDLFRGLALRHRMYIIGGTHLVAEGDHLFNAAHLFYPDGRVAVQAKVHLTPTERGDWGIAAGDRFLAFDTEYGRIAILICYDVEFPEAARTVSAMGADIIFCPSSTDDVAGFWRVRHCCHARAVENQVYVVQAVTVGGLPRLRFMEQSYGQAAIISPCDVSFPHEGIVASGEINCEQVVIGDVDLDLLREARSTGSVTPLRDRRPEVYRFSTPFPPAQPLRGRNSGTL